ncbi:hypothetical protein Slin14017_G073920 [Septoria linicola]|nr:hypothetical protein Slin14017_G073920 [Septoria linicola]
MLARAEPVDIYNQHTTPGPRAAPSYETARPYSSESIPWAAGRSLSTYCRQGTLTAGSCYTRDNEESRSSTIYQPAAPTPESYLTTSTWYFNATGSTTNRASGTVPSLSSLISPILGTSPCSTEAALPPTSSGYASSSSITPAAPSTSEEGTDFNTGYPGPSASDIDTTSSSARSSRTQSPFTTEDSDETALPDRTTTFTATRTQYITRSYGTASTTWSHGLIYGSSGWFPPAYGHASATGYIPDRSRTTISPNPGGNSTVRAPFTSTTLYHTASSGHQETDPARPIGTVSSAERYTTRPQSGYAPIASGTPTFYDGDVPRYSNSSRLADPQTTALTVTESPVLSATRTQPTTRATTDRSQSWPYPSAYWAPTTAGYPSGPISPTNNPSSYTTFRTLTRIASPSSYATPDAYSDPSSDHEADPSWHTNFWYSLASMMRSFRGHKYEAPGYGEHGPNGKPASYHG